MRYVSNRKVPSAEKKLINDVPANENTEWQQELNNIVMINLPENNDCDISKTQELFKKFEK